MDSQVYQPQEQQQEENNFLEISVISEILQTIDQIESRCKGQIGEDIVNERIKQVAYAKILCNVYNKDITYLIKAYTQLGIAYYDINYFEQAQEHLLNAFKLNENLSDEDNLNMKEYQIKILINLAKCYLENEKLEAALQISERSLKMNQTLFGENHISNADIYYVLAKVNTKMKNYKTAIDNLRNMFEIYEKIYGFDSEKTAKICMEMGQIYELWNNLNDAIEYYNNSYKIWEKIITDDNYEVLFQLAMLLSELYAKVDKGEDAYEILKSTDDNYSDKIQRSIKNRVVFQRCRIKASSYVKDMDLYLQENLKLEEILNETNENQKTLAKTCISIGYIYLEKNEKNKCLEYFQKAEKIFIVNGDNKLANDIKNRILEVQKKEDKVNDQDSQDKSHSDD
jgi:tetratricopeptide (TPR) repeat protein